MITSSLLNLRELEDRLYTHEGAQGYAILDGASVPGALTTLDKMGVTYDCLYLGRLEPEVAAVAPYLVKLDEDGQLFDWLTGEDAPDHWGTYLSGVPQLQMIRRQLRKCTYVMLPEGKKYYFRYYDPRVLREFLPMADEEQKHHLFGDAIRAYYADSEKPGEYHEFR